MTTKIEEVAENPPVTLQIAVPVPLRRSFDYLFDRDLPAGTRVSVPFGRRRLVGIVTSSDPSSIATNKLKRIEEQLDSFPTFDPLLFKLIRWSSKYYHYPIGEAFATALPGKLRTVVHTFDPTLEPHYRLTFSQIDDTVQKLLGRSPKQRAAINLLFQLGETRNQSTPTTPLPSGHPWLSAREILELLPGSQGILKKLVERQLLETDERPSPITQAHSVVQSDVTLTFEQQDATRQIIERFGTFAPFLLNGITGSGKTEVYLHAAQRAIQSGYQVLVLVPEISLTPQLINRFKARLGERVCAVHSSITDQERYKTWWRASQGEASVVLGTRSAVFTPLKNPGLIIIDEEHDISYKQQDGFRYHARDVAIKRASLSQIPIVLGSATPSMESMHNLQVGKYQPLNLTQRIGESKLPKTHLIDLNTQPAPGGISLAIIDAVGTRLKRGEQSILYINRRGFAPVVQCAQCAWQAICSRCDSHLIYHQNTQKFRCHHCNSVKHSHKHCPKCESELFFVGLGTQRVEAALSKAFPDARICRLDRDEVTTQIKLENELKRIADQQVDIIIGTQLITKGHDFPNVTLVGVVNSDQGLYSIDFRSTEYLFQQLVQVSGRAGRASLPGNVLIQTAHPDNLYLGFIKEQNFSQFSAHCLGERQSALLPPFSYVALWRAESPIEGEALRFLQVLSSSVAQTEDPVQNKVMVMDPVHSPMEKLAGRYRAQLMVKSTDRRALHVSLNQWLNHIERLKQANRVRWSLDVDPMDMF